MTTLERLQHPPEADGQVLTYFSDFYTVQLRNGTRLACKRKALLKKQGIRVCVGDYVTVEAHDSQMGWITPVLTPHSVLSRPRIHNVSHVLIACPWHEPRFDLRQLDRLLTKVLLAQLTPFIVFTKRDIQIDETHEGFTLEQWLTYYQQEVGVRCLSTSIYEADSIETLKQELLNTGGTWVLAGVSGAGKSSLLNAVDPELNLRVDAISHKGGRGTHTTRHTELLNALQQVLIADAPGFSQLDFTEDLPPSIAQAFSEIKSITDSIPCAFQDCLHQDEKDCSVKTAVETGTFLQARYQHYTEMLEESQTAYQDSLVQSKKQEEKTKQSKLKKGGKSVQIVKLNPELRESNRKQNKQVLKQLEQDLTRKQRHHGFDLDAEASTLDDYRSL